MGAANPLALHPSPPTPFPDGDRGGRQCPSRPGTEVGEGAFRAHRFLICWFIAYLVVFSTAATKLPNYIFPLYPALAILTARFLIAWRDRTLAAPNWVMGAGTGAMAVVGVVSIAGLILANERFPGLGIWAAAGLPPLAAALGHGASAPAR